MTKISIISWLGITVEFLQLEESLLYVLEAMHES